MKRKSLGRKFNKAEDDMWFPPKVMNLPGVDSLHIGDPGNILRETVDTAYRTNWFGL
jgi:hypothetical protein